MSAPVRFLSVAVLAWTLLRASTLGALPGFTVSYAKPVPPAPIVRTELMPPALALDAASAWAMPPQSALLPASLPAPGSLSAAMPARFTGATPYFLSAYPPMQSAYYAAPIAPRAAWSLPPGNPGDEPWTASPTPAGYSKLPPIVPTAGFPQRSTPVAQVGKPGLDRWQMSSWALLRGPPAPGALATGGTLGGSQGGARVTYAFTRTLAASLRTTSPVGGSRGAEIAGGIRWAPLRSIPVAFTVERRQSISPRGGGRSDFALFVEGGLYKRPMPWRFELDAYAQAGVVGIAHPDFFVDGSMAFTRPIYGRFSAGFGMWGGYQPGLYRLDAGPRVSMRVRDNIRAHANWRQRIVGNALPASGPTLTLAADF